MGDLQIFQNPFADGNKWDNNHKLFKPIEFVQFIDGTQIHISFTRACLHLHREIHPLQFPVLTLYFVALLYSFYILPNLLLGQCQFIPQAVLREQCACFGQRELKVPAAQGLPLKQKGRMSLKGWTATERAGADPR